MTFGEHLREIRLARGLSQAELGELIGVSQQQINKYEHRTDYPKMSTMKKLAEALKCSPEELYYSDGKLIINDQTHSTSNVVAFYDLEETSALRQATSELENISYTLNEAGRKRLLEYARLLQDAYKKGKSEDSDAEPAKN